MATEDGKVLTRVMFGNCFLFMLVNCLKGARPVVLRARPGSAWPLSFGWRRRNRTFSFRREDGAAGRLLFRGRVVRVMRVAG